MKNLIFKAVRNFSFLIAIYLFSCYAPANNNEKEKLALNTMVAMLRNQHYLVKDYNDQFSKELFEQYLKIMDVNKRFLLQSDVDQLKKFETQLDDEIKGSNFLFFENAITIIEKRVDDVGSWYPQMLEKSFDFTKNEQFEYDAKKRKFPENEAAQKAEWLRYFKYQVLTNMAIEIDIQEKAGEKKDTIIKILTLAEMEEKAREKVLKNHKDWFKRLKQTDRADRMSDYLNAISQIYDPHTDFYAPKDKENFDIQLSGQLEGIGATLTQKDGYIKVAAIVPGSPSYKQGQLKAEDMILKVAQAENEPVDVVDMKLDQAIKLIRGKKGTLVKLTVKKPDGSLVVIPIVRDVVIIEDTYAKSVILQKDGFSERIGYIYLPTFYADFTNQRGGRTCYEDVRKEIDKLKLENIDGIVLDLRNNGGGSLGDVVKMAGLFIPSGPIVQVKGRDAAPIRLNDEDMRVQYEGPLVVMVNTFSASASEILAAAMQDYKRAIIVGSEHTYGKGTVQRIFDLDQALSGTYASLKPFGSVKLTTQKFYRINGGATQLKGVVPDIILPDVYKHVKVGEKELDKVMPWDQISPAFFKEFDRPNSYVDALKNNSLKRQKLNPTFLQIEAAAFRLKTRQDQTKFTLNLEKYKEEQKKIQTEEQGFKDATKNEYNTQVFTLRVDEDPDADEAKKDRKKAFQESLKKDVYLSEVLHILHDMVQPK